jgi:hypothetical protein
MGRQRKELEMGEGLGRRPRAQHSVWHFHREASLLPNLRKSRIRAPCAPAWHSTTVDYLTSQLCTILLVQLEQKLVFASKFSTPRTVSGAYVSNEKVQEDVQTWS